MIKKYFIVSSILIIKLFAVNINDIDIGDIYYINGYLNDDRRVVIEKVEKSTKRVKVRTSNGDTEWVYSNKLLTKNENSNLNSYGLPAAAVITGIAALIYSNSESDTNSNDGFGIHVKNNCSQTMPLAIRYMPANKDKVVTKYWWKFKPQKSAYLYSDNTKLLTKISVIYYYAFGGNGYKIDGYKKVFFDGKNRWMKKLVDKDGDTNIILNCN